MVRIKLYYLFGRIGYQLCVSFFFLSLLFLTVRANAQNRKFELKSPNGTISISFFVKNISSDTNGTGQLYYKVLYKGKAVIDPSKLDLLMKGEKRSLGSHVKVVSIDKSQDNRETYQLAHGKTSFVNEVYNMISLHLNNNSSLNELIIQARAYNDGVAFRYVIPKRSNSFDIVRLKDERTQFQMSEDAIAYAQVLPNFRSMYESEYIKLPLSAFANRGGVASHVLMGLPLLMELPGVGWAAIMDANLKDYASTYVTNPTGSWTGHMLETRLSPQVEDTSVAIIDTLPFHSSWKVIMIGDTPGKFIESNIITSLNPSSKIENSSWIIPGKASWNWWNGSLDAKGVSHFTTKNMEYYVDFAASSGFKYMLIDAGWSAGNDITHMNGRVNIPEVVQYAKRKGVKIWIWTAYDQVVEQMDKAFPLYEQWGIAGIKIDFIERDDQRGMQFYYEVARKAAKYHLMVDFHGCTKPTGMIRTWPNVMGYEAILGMEQSKAGRRDNPYHHVMLPYTRMLAGPMDYTPGGFDNATRSQFKPRMKNPMVMGTRAHQLAMYVCFESPFQMVSDNPSAYLNQASFEFIKKVPTAWDETRFIDGMPGKYVIIARKKGDNWFLGGMTNWKERNLKIPLKFLGKGKFKAIIYKDAKDANKYPKKVIIETKVLDPDMYLNIKLAKGGGVAIEFYPIEK